MTRKRCRRRAVQPLPPRGLRPRLAPDQVRDLGLAHVTNLDAMARGEGDHTTLWHWAEAVMTWSRVAELLGAGQAEMGGQLELVATVLERYRRTRRALFTGTEYQLAKLGVGYMDDLAAIVDRATAEAAAAWSELYIAQRQAELAPAA